MKSLDNVLKKTTIAIIVYVSNRLIVEIYKLGTGDFLSKSPNLDWLRKEAVYIRVGIPGGLLYYHYEAFLKTFFNELDIDTLLSIETNKNILDMGVNYCINDACLPMKIFHGHVANLKDKCDYLFIPRIMKSVKKESICPKFCGLPEMVMSGIKRREGIISYPVKMNSTYDRMQYFIKIGRNLGVREYKTVLAYKKALEEQKKQIRGIKDDGYRYQVFLGGHPYNIYDKFANMNLINKLHDYNIGVITEERVSEADKVDQIRHFIKKPYWLFFKNNYGAGQYLSDNKMIDGIVYISSFSCGIDSITIEMLRNNVTNMPFLVLKVDEHTGEAGINTRIEAFADMLERRRYH